MDLFLSLYPTLLLTLMCFFPIGMPFTVIMSDSGVPSTLVDAPQTGFSNKNGARTDAKEQEAVYDIMKATGNSWATDIPDVCRGRWHGIECMPDKDNVFHIVSLSFGELSDDTAFPTCDPARSFISPSVTKLPHLRTLFFYRCFSDNPQPIPAFLGRLGSTLQTLVLRGNGHVGPIPDELGNLTRLKVLDLHENNLNGWIPVSLGQLTGLRSLDLSGNRLTGSVPNLTLPVLNILDLNQNHLVGPIPSTIGNCHSLLKIDFSRNRFSGPIPKSISGLENLVLLDLSYNLLTGPLPISLKNLNSLQALILKGNSMDSTIIPNDGFDGFKGLMILDLSEMNLHGPIPESLGYLTNLRVLHLDGNHLNGSIPKTFRDLINLSELRLNSNWLTGPVPFRREVVWRMRGKLRLYNNSGLCYDARNGFENGLDSLVESGIGYCETAKPTKTVLHFSTVDGEVERSSSQSSAPVYKCSIIPIMLIQLTTVLLFVLYLS